MVLINNPFKEGEYTVSQGVSRQVAFITDICLFLKAKKPFCKNY